MKKSMILVDNRSEMSKLFVSSFFQHFDVLVNSSGLQNAAGLHVVLHGNISTPVRVTDLVEVSKDAASLIVCTRKKFFA